MADLPADLYRLIDEAIQQVPELLLKNLWIAWHKAGQDECVAATEKRLVLSR